MKRNHVIFFAAGLFLILGFRGSETPKASIQDDNRLMAAAWYALSAEKEACYLQTYRFATWQLERQASRKNKPAKSYAIVTDLDETVLDNSGWQIRVISEGKDYPSYWAEWEQASKAPAFPGAVSFFQKAKELNIPIYYVSNRLAKNLSATITNLKNLGLPNADSSHILLKSSTSNKIERRSQVLKNHEILMLLGDNLADFDGIWEDADPEKRMQAVTENEQKWGKKFIIFPNPLYGNWKESLFSYKRNFTRLEADSIWNFHLNNYMKNHSF
jgi:5'-nucleotidase (lipoprotein e(P4) family)